MQEVGAKGRSQGSRWVAVSAGTEMYHAVEWRRKCDSISKGEKKMVKAISYLQVKIADDVKGR